MADLMAVAGALIGFALLVLFARALERLRASPTSSAWQ